MTSAENEYNWTQLIDAILAENNVSRVAGNPCLLTRITFLSHTDWSVS
jgi:hypothetical protein